MKTLKSILGLTLLAALPSVAPAAEIPWSTFTGGGGIGQHGAVALGGAIGPIAPTLSPATGGNYTLTGGFWPAFPGKPQPVSPLLKIKSLGDGTIRLSWPIGLAGFLLEYTPQLGSGDWFSEKTSIVKTATEHTVTVLAESSRCYRLRSE